MNNGRVIISSDYLDAASRVYPALSKSPLQIYVEGDADVRFWAPLFNKYKDKYEINISRAFEVAANDGKAANGCSRIASLINSGQLVLGKNLLVCIDSDYRFILNDYKNGYEFVPGNKYVMETGVCAKENVICAPDGLREIIQKSISLTTWFPSFDFCELFVLLSKTFFILQSLHLFYLSENNRKAVCVNEKLVSELSLIQQEIKSLDYSKYDMGHFKTVLKLSRKNGVAFFKNNLEDSRRKDFGVFLAQVYSRMGGYVNAMYFVRGHDIYNYVISDLMGKGSYLLLEHEKQRRLALGDAEGVSQLYNEKISTTALLQCREDYYNCESFKCVIDKIDDALVA
ncbi:DUF4435 domain-containing protein [Kluyvera ascorbata]|uniref:DUF4435 domain-containing protein n=1 Tax=Kluyvera ascorbata TaxID=51288 RepID=UPI0022E3B425|nr:DUF4435 domain-containing protein [Kluyvera ascorbata]